MEVCVEREFVVLGNKLELEKAMEKEIIKRLVGRPKKKLQAILLTSKVENLE